MRIHQPAKLTSVETSDVDAQGRPIRIACQTCHSLQDGGALPSGADGLETFHAGLTFSHGSLACGSCHQAESPRQLHLATGEAVAMADVMLVCGQCHGPQLRDYRQGSHGGMVGYWDLSRGPRSRNNCVDCHDPHAPAIPKMMPVHLPRDRFLGGHEAPPTASGSAHPPSDRANASKRPTGETSARTPVRPEIAPARRAEP